MFALDLVLNNKLYLDDFFSSAVENNQMFRSELKVKRDELREIVKTVDRKFTENCRFNDETCRTGWTVEEMTEFCDLCHKARLKIFDYMNDINNLIRAQLV